MHDAASERLVAIVATTPASADDGFGAAVAHHRGRVAGTGLAVFTTVRDALASALDLGGAVAVHAGLVVDIDGQLVGEGVTTASVLVTAVPAGEVWCTASLRGLADRLPGIAFHPRPAVRPHPFERAIEIVAVTATSAGARRRAVLSGRDRELDQAERHLRRALAGCGGTLLITGEPGVGKTRLTQEVAASAAAHGALVVTGRCGIAGSSPYQPFVEIATS